MRESGDGIRNGGTCMSGDDYAESASRETVKAVQLMDQRVTEIAAVTDVIQQRQEAKRAQSEVVLSLGEGTMLATAWTVAGDEAQEKLKSALLEQLRLLLGVPELK